MSYLEKQFCKASELQSHLPRGHGERNGYVRAMVGPFQEPPETM